MTTAKKSVLGCLGLFAMLALQAGTAAAEPPPIRTSATNKVPACVTPEKLMQFLRTRNSHLLPEFENIAELYKQHGEALGVRWDYAFYQMGIETNFLTYRTGGGGWGDVRPKQYNFAGIGTTGGGVPGDQFPDSSAGVLAQLQHLVVYSGERVPNPTAKRTREKQDDILAWTAKLAERRPVTFTDLAGRWAVDRRYARSIETIAERFRNNFCNGQQEAQASPDKTGSSTAAASDDDDTPRKARKGRRARTAAHQPRGKHTRMPRRSRDRDEDTEQTTSAEPMNDGKGSIIAAETTKPVLADASTVDEKIEAMKQTPQGPAMRSGLGLGLMAGGTLSESAAAQPGACKVWTASYGGNKAVIIKAPLGGQTSFTVLGVTDQNAKTEIDAYIAAYAKNGQPIAEFKTEDQALAKAFELCPKG